MKSKLTIFLTAFAILLWGCNSQQRKLDFTLEGSDTGDQATNPVEIAPNLWASFMHNYHYRIFARFDTKDQRYYKGMTCVITLKNADGDIYTESYTLTQRILALADVNDDRHKRFMEDDIINIKLNNITYQLYDPEMIKRAFQVMNEAAENPAY
jgi:hypothetical protein